MIAGLTDLDVDHEFALADNVRYSISTRLAWSSGAHSSSIQYMRKRLSMYKNLCYYLLSQTFLLIDTSSPNLKTNNLRDGSSYNQGDVHILDGALRSTQSYRHKLSIHCEQ